MKHYDEMKPLYLETDASEIRLGATLLQTRGGTTCTEDIASDNTILRPTTFACRSLPNTE